jgi:hypothetical protein
MRAEGALHGLHALAEIFQPVIKKPKSRVFFGTEYDASGTHEQSDRMLAMAPLTERNVLSA